jgi:predicted extracellular nuclease
VLLRSRRRALGALALLSATLGGLAVAPTPSSAVATDLLISEYVEGSSFNKAIEIENKTGAAVDLAAGGYAVRTTFQTGTAQRVALTGTLAAGEVLVIAHAQAAASVLAVADVVSTDVASFNGDDAVELTKGGDPGTVVDSIGQVGFDPGTEWGGGNQSTAEATLRRPAANETADTDSANAYDPAAIYNGFDQNTFDGLGFPGDTTSGPQEPELRPIGQIQGQDTGPTSRSPYAPPSGNGAGTEVLSARGIVTERSLARTSSGGSNNGFWLQTRPVEADDNNQTSDGIFVFTGASPTVDGYTPTVGDDVTVTARVSEFFFATQLTSVSDVVLHSAGNAVPGGVDADPPADAEAAGVFWEAREGMQVLIPAGAGVTGGRSVFPGTADSEIWMIPADDPLMDRADPYARRTFRDAHPLDAQPGLFDDGNAQRILIGPQGVKAAAADSTVLLPPARTFDTLGGAVRGALNYSFDKYRIEVATQPTFTPGADPAANGAPQAPDRATEYSVGNINVENLYDRRDDPTDGCDFTGNAGCTGVSPPFDYVPAGDQVYADRLAGLSIQIREALHAPDVVTVQEAEDQDICSVTGTTLTCGGAEAGDGRPDTVQELALEIAADGGPVYDVASDRDGADARGIHNAFLWRTDRVALAEPSASDPILGSDPGVDYRGAASAFNAEVENPKALNADLPGDVDTSTGVDGSNVYTRAAQTGRFQVYAETAGVGDPVDLWVVNSHFSSTPDARVGQRTEQAAYAAAVAGVIEAEVPEGELMVAGDLNVFPRPDDPVPPSDGGPSDQLAPLYDAGLTSLWDVLVDEVPAAAYSYVFEGQAQTLDQQFVGDGLLADLVEQRVAHVNADWPAEHQPATGRGVSDHDPSVARFALPPPPVPQLDDEDFVVQQFADLVGRPPTPSEREVYTEALADGSLTRPRLVDNLRRIAYDPDRAPVIRLYLAALGRGADVDGVEYWVDRYRDGLSLRQMARLFVGSPEFRTEYGQLDDAEFVQLVYDNVLDRDASEADLDYWVGRLEGGLTRAEMMVFFSESAENKTLTRPTVDASEIFFALLGRTPTASELNSAAARVGTLAGRLEVIEEIITSQEYAERVGA